MRRRTIIFSLLVVLALGVGVAFELHQTFRFTRLLQLGLLLLVLVAAATIVKGRVRNWTIAATSLVLGLIVIEGGGLALETPRPVFDDGGMNASRSVVGWGAGKPGTYEARKVDPQGRPVYDVHITIDDNLIRKTDSAKGPGAYAFFGDSYTIGEGLEDKDTLAQSFADLIGRKQPVLNLGYSGWSPAQNLAALQAGLYAPLLVAPRRFILTTAAWQIERTSCKSGFSQRAPRYTLVGGKLERQGQCGSALMNGLHAVLRRFALYHELVAPIAAAPTRRDVETYLKIVQAFVETAKRKYGVGTTIIFIPYVDPYLQPTGYGEDDIIRAFRQMGADVLLDQLPEIDDMNRYFIQGDGHPTGLANRALAKMLLDHLRIVAPETLRSETPNAPRR